MFKMRYYMLAYLSSRYHSLSGKKNLTSKAEKIKRNNIYTTCIQIVFQG